VIKRVFPTPNWLNFKTLEIRIFTPLLNDEMKSLIIKKCHVMCLHAPTKNVLISYRSTDGNILIPNLFVFSNSKKYI